MTSPLKVVTAAPPIEAARAVDVGGWRLTELGNAQRFAAMHACGLRYVQAWERWLVWDGRRWCRAELGDEVAAGKALVAALYVDAAEFSGRAAAGDEAAGGLAQALTKWARTSSKASSIKSMLSLARSEPPIAALREAFDRDAFALNVLNGTIDLRTAELRSHRPEDMLTALAPVRFDRSARGVEWERFLARVLPDAEVRGWVQRYLGYALTGDVREQVMAFFVGAGANGKSVLLDVVLGVIGDYGLRAAPDLVLAKYGDAHPTELADLEGRRLVVCSEIEQGRAWAESTIKRITGDSTITARRMRQDFYTFPASHKLAVAANTRPTVRGTDHAIWRRMRVVPWSVTIADGEQDRELPRRLVHTEADAVLAWLVEGCLAWQREGLGQAGAIALATAGYRAEQDVVGEWIDDECTLVATAFTTTKGLYASYSAWCERTGREAWTQNTMRQRLLERGLTDHRTPAARGIRGIALRASAAQGDADR